MRTDCERTPATRFGNLGGLLTTTALGRVCREWSAHTLNFCEPGSRTYGMSVLFFLLLNRFDTQRNGNDEVVLEGTVSFRVIFSAAEMHFSSPNNQCACACVCELSVG